MNRVIITLLLASLASICFAEEQWVERRDIYNLTGNLSFGAKWDAQKGISFKISHGNADKAIIFKLNSKDINIHLTPKKEFPSDLIDHCQLNTESLPSNNLERAEIVLKFRRRIWTLYIENRPIAVLPVPFVPPLTLAQPQEEIPVAKLRDVYFQRIAGIDKFQDDFMVPEDAPNQLEHWKVDSGTWTIHSVAENNIVTTKKRKRSKPEADYSPNFYSLQGSGDNAIITAGHEFYDSYMIEASVQVVPGEMGLIFFYKKNKGHLGFTIDMDKNSPNVILKLWKAQSGKKNERIILAAVTTTLTKKQWVKLKVKTFLNRIQCSMDNVELIDISTELPAGGKFGLFANHTSGVRFDDVLASQNRDLDLKGVDHIRRHTLAKQGRFFPKKNSFNLFSKNKQQAHLDVPKSKLPQWMMIGSPEDDSHLFSATFTPSNATYSIGLIVGYTSVDNSYMRFTCEKTLDSEIFQLSDITTNGARIIEEVTIPRSETSINSKNITLMCDATNNNELRMYRNKKLVLIHTSKAPRSGASGLYVGAGSPTQISNPTYCFQRDDLFRNQFEKNRLYIKDPFMRHWSSPEGQWIEMPNKLVWHKSDFFGRFLLRMPHLNGTEIHLGVQEGSINGTIIIKSTSNSISVEPGPEITKSGKAKELFLNSEKTLTLKAHTKADWFTVQYEDHCLWITANKQTILKYSLRNPLKGTRIRISGFTTEQLSESYVERFNVKDHLFTHALSEWTINGGEWSVVNRFKCQPRWSHMNGESKNNLAAIWSKYNIKGDFCAEMYAGMRHGWYERAGDLNITVMNQTTTAGEGYTVTCTGWDEDHSQLFTKLFKNGKQIAISDKFLVPRKRKSIEWHGKGIRLGWNPLINKGRALHGAWFYIKLRRIGKKLEYYFDNELVFSINDDTPIESGSFGIWTFMNSMVVARVKVAAQHIEPKSFVFTALDIDQADKLFHPPKATQRNYDNVLINSQPLETSLPKNWVADDPTGQSQLTWQEEADSGPYFVSHSILGGGNAFTKCEIPPVKANQLAGWHFYLKQNDDARLNFHYSIGSKNANGEYTPKHHFFHHISGTDFSKGNFKLTGHTNVPHIKSPNINWHTTEKWTPVNAWIPTQIIPPDTTNSIWIKAEGFGNLQPSNIQQGLNGNKPGAAYAIRDFSEIRYETPLLSAKENTLDQSYSITIKDRNEQPIEFSNITNAQHCVENITSQGLIRLSMETKRPTGTTKNDISWIRAPKKMSLSCTWNKEVPYSITLNSNSNYPDKRLNNASMRIESIPSPLAAAGTGRMIALLPRNKKIFKNKRISISVSLGNETYQFSLNKKDCPHNEPPVLMSLGNLTSSFENFEQRKANNMLTLAPKRITLENFDPTQGTFLKIANTGSAQRLQIAFQPHAELSQLPLLQFRYRAGPMSHVTFITNKGIHINFSEQYKHKSTAHIRGSKEPILDGKWHTWYGMLSDIVTNQPITKDVFYLSQLKMGSIGEVDQTGLFSEFHIDDIIFAPAISTSKNLVFTPEYFEFSGIKTILHSIHQGPIPFDELDNNELSNLKWKETPPSEEIKPDISNLIGGISRLFIKAKGINEKTSTATDIPFYMASTPLKVSYDFTDSSKPEHNGSTFAIFAETGGIPLDISNIKINWNGDSVEIPPLGTEYIHEANKDTIYFNWAYIFRNQLCNTIDKQVVKIKITGIRNGAGATFHDLITKHTIDYEKDQTPPTLTATQYPTNIFSYTGWEDISQKQTYFKKTTGNPKLQLIRKQNSQPYLEITPTKTDTSITHKFDEATWSIEKYPYIAFMIRFPKKGHKKDAEFIIKLATRKRNSHAIHLTNTSFKQRNFKFTEIPNNMKNRIDIWQTVKIDMREILGNRISKRKINRLKFRSISFCMDEDSSPFDLQNVFIFADGTSEDKVAINAFDASGIAGIRLNHQVETKSMKVQIAPPYLSNNFTGWVSLQAKDKAGNYSHPIHIPIWPMIKTK